MTIQQFLELNELEKLCAIMESWRLMAQKLEPETRIFLYRMQTFYVSACYSIETDQLTEITAYIDVEESMPHFRKFLISIHPAERQYDTPEFWCYTIEYIFVTVTNQSGNHHNFYVFFVAKYRSTTGTQGEVSL